jgi:hypothetical protein
MKAYSITSDGFDVMDIHFSGKSDLHFSGANSVMLCCLIFKLKSESSYEKLWAILDSSISCILAGFKFYMIQ